MTSPTKLEVYDAPDQNMNPVSKYKGNQLKNGDSPFNSCFGRGRREGPCWVIFRNRNESDAIVILVDYYTGKTIRNEYIEAGAEFKMSSIPSGSYVLKTVYGNDWNPNIQSPCGSSGFFESNVSYGISEKINDVLNFSNSYGNYSTYTTTLYTVANGNMSQRSAETNEIFK